MTVQNSVAVRNAYGDVFESTIGTAAKIALYTGAPPADCATAASGTKLIEWTLASDWSAAAASGVKSLSGTPLTATGLADGTAGYYRITNNAGSTCHEQGTVTRTAAAWAISTAYTIGQYRRANGNLYLCDTNGTSAGSGTGPSGTGTNIADGTTQWDYVSAYGDATIDNPVIATDQTITISSWSKTYPGA